MLRSEKCSFNGRQFSISMRCWTPSKVTPIDLDLILRIVRPGTNFLINTQFRLTPAVKLFHATGAQLNAAGKECVNCMIFKFKAAKLNYE